MRHDPTRRRFLKSAAAMSVAASPVGGRGITDPAEERQHQHPVQPVHSLVAELCQSSRAGSACQIGPDTIGRTV
jgi:hypothetical protein